MNKIYIQPFILTIDIDSTDFICESDGRGAGTGTGDQTNPDVKETKSLNIVDFNSSSDDDW